MMIPITVALPLLVVLFVIALYVGQRLRPAALPQSDSEKQRLLEATKADIGWGSQIRNYVLDQSRIKDLRTGIERSDTQKVLDGDLDEFVEASLKSGLEAGAKRVDAA